MSKTKEFFMQQRQWEQDNVPTNYGDYLEYDYEYYQYYQNKNYLNKLKKKRNASKPSRLSF